MAHSVELFFDGEADKAIRSLWQRLERAGVPSLASRTYPGKKKVRYQVAHYRTFVPTTAVRLPHAYLVPAALAVPYYREDR